MHVETQNASTMAAADVQPADPRLHPWTVTVSSIALPLKTMGCVGMWSFTLAHRTPHTALRVTETCVRRTVAKQDMHVT